MLAYACGPGRGSEESVGWDTAASLAEAGFRVTVLTRTAERNTCPAPSERPELLDIVCHDNPSVRQHRFDRMGKLGVEFGYLNWLFSVRPLISDLHRQRGFTSAQHVTYARYWMPSPLRVLDIPWILGPVGGGESIPRQLRGTLSRSGLLFEAVRDAMRWLGERSKSVREAASSCRVAMANTRETAARLSGLGSTTVEVMNSAALADAEFARLSEAAKTVAPEDRSGFVSIGRLLDWKGFHLGLQAFALSALHEETYTIVGTGPFEARLRAMANKLGIADRVHFTGAIPREEVFDRLGSARALIHPSLHESGGFVCLEAMATGTPVICVDTGGPGLFVRPELGYAVAANSPATTIESLADAMRLTVLDPADYALRRENSIEHVRTQHTMQAKVSRLAKWHTSFALEAEVRLGGEAGVDVDSDLDMEARLSGTHESDTTRLRPAIHNGMARERTSESFRGVS